MPIKLKNLIGRPCRVRELTSDERKRLINEQWGKTVKIDGEKYCFVIETDDDVFLIDAFCVRKKLANPTHKKTV